MFWISIFGIEMASYSQLSDLLYFPAPKHSDHMFLGGFGGVRSCIHLGRNGEFLRDGNADSKSRNGVIS